MTDQSYNKNIDLKHKSYSGGSYTHTRLFAQSGGGSYTLTANANQTLVFDLPNKVYNPAQSFLRWEQGVLAGGATTFKWWLLSAPPIARMALRTRSGQPLADIPNFRQFWKQNVNLITSNNDFVNYPYAMHAQTLANARLQGQCRFHNPSGALPATAAAGETLLARGVSEAGALTATTDTFRKAYVGPANIAVAADNKDSYLSCCIPLEKIPFCFFGMNKDFYSTEALQLEVELCAGDKILFEGDTAVTAISNAVTSPELVAITNFSLYLAVEQNEIVSEQIKAVVMKAGHSMLIPYATTYSVNLGTATSGNVQLKLNRGLGKQCLRIISSETVAADSLNLSSNFYNYNGALTSIYRTMLDSVSLQQESLNATLGTDFEHNHKFLKGSPLDSLVEYQSWCPAHIDDFSGIQDLRMASDLDLHDMNALDLSVEHTWNKNIETKSATNTNCFVTIVCQKVLVSSAAGIQVM